METTDKSTAPIICGEKPAEITRKRRKKAAPGPLSRSTTVKLDPFPRERFAKFCEKLKVNTRDFGLIPFNLLGSQQYILDEICKGMDEGVSTFVILKSRQLGSSTFFMALNLFWCFNYSGLFGAIITHIEQLRDQFRNMIDVYKAHLPASYKVSVNKSNRNMLIFDNGSTIAYLTAGTKESSKGGGLGTGGSFNYLHSSETARYGNEEDLKNLRAALSSRYPHRMQIYESTAKGHNFYEEMCEIAKESPTQRFIFVGWWRNELFRFEKDSMEYAAYLPAGDQSNMEPLERRRIKLVKELYDFNIEYEQVAWYRWKLKDEYGGDQQKMDEDFPWTAEDAFVATGSKFFTNESLGDAMRDARRTPYMPYRYSLTTKWSDTQVMPYNDRRAELKIFEEADPTGHYVLSCDPAFGSGDTANRTAIFVGRAFADCIVQVAEFCTNKVETAQAAWVAAHLAGYYRGFSGCSFILEITGPGQHVILELDKLRQETHLIFPKDRPDLQNCLASMKNYYWRRTDSIGGSISARHWQTTQKTKPLMMNALRDSLNLGRIIIRSMPCLEEMRTIVQDDGVIEAEGSKNDDRAIAAALANIHWLQWVQPNLRAQGLTRARSAELTKKGIATTAQAVTLNFLQQQKIKLPEKT